MSLFIHKRVCQVISEAYGQTIFRVIVKPAASQFTTSLAFALGELHIYIPNFIEMHPCVEA